MKDRPTPDNQARWDTAYVQLLREWIAAGESAWLPLWGESMAPFLHSGSRLLVSRATACQIASGDLLVYEAEGRLICHRVLRRRACGGRHVFLTKGDGWRTKEAWICADQVLGRVTRVERNGGTLPLDTPIRRLRATGIAAYSLMVADLLALLRWGRRHLRLRWT
jgi:signal peptidase I